MTAAGFPLDAAQTFLPVAVDCDNGSCFSAQNHRRSLQTAASLPPLSGNITFTQKEKHCACLVQFSAVFKNKYNVLKRYVALRHAFFRVIRGNVVPEISWQKHDTSISKRAWGLSSSSRVLPYNKIRGSSIPPLNRLPFFIRRQQRCPFLPMDLFHLRSLPHVLLQISDHKFI